MVFKQIIEYIAESTDSITDVLRVIVNKTEDGPSIYVEVEVKFGINIISELNKFKEKCIKEIERQTTMNITNMRIVAKKISLPQF